MTEKVNSVNIDRERVQKTSQDLTNKNRELVAEVNILNSRLE